MQYAVILLILVQVILVGGTAAVYLRLRAHSDTDNRTVDSWSMKIDTALNFAQGASAKVEMIEVSHFNALRAKLEAQALEIADFKIEIGKLRAEVVTLRTTIASARRYERKAEAENLPDLHPESGPSKSVNGSIPRTLEEAIANGMALPLDHSPNPVKTARTFGQIP